MGSVIGLLTAVAFGVDGYTTYHGIWGYNSALTAMALGGFFIVLTVSCPLWGVTAHSATRVILPHGHVACCWGLVAVSPFTLHSYT